MTTTTEIIHALDLQISRLTQARALLRNGNHLPLAHREYDDGGGVITVSGGGTVTSHPITFPFPPGAGRITNLRTARRDLSPAARDRISRAQKKRWRRYHREKKAGAA
ncbi:MAG: hypothetical protein OK454_08820 [Thaumarchaeota archaeon]|nr:hypothetical protein [Nitrososphaerota archaeon]